MMLAKTHVVALHVVSKHAKFHLNRPNGLRVPDLNRGTSQDFDLFCNGANESAFSGYDVL
jgi:hypothetical protein